jgi:hypothetical protein
VSDIEEGGGEQAFDHINRMLKKSIPGLHKLNFLTAQIGPAARTGQHAGGCHLVPAGRTLEPEFAIFALMFSQPLLLAAFWALPVHLAIFDVVFKQQSAARAGGGIVLPDLGQAVRIGTDEYRFAGAAPVFAFFLFLANGAFFHDGTHR